MTAGVLRRAASPAFPLLRAAKYDALRWRAALQVRLGRRFDRAALPRMAFIVGCGRSGTTALGSALGEHPEVSYLFEPYYLWTSVNRDTDVSGLFGTRAARMFMDDQHATDHDRRAFKRAILATVGGSRPVVLEKTPHNALRIGYMDALSEGARFVHISRDGVDVAKSIADIATDSRYRIAFRRRMNTWWGVEEAKWHALARDGSEAGYFPDEVSRLTTQAARGAYEWLVTLREMDRWRPALAGRLLEVTYPQFTAHPAETLSRIAEHLGIGRPGAWVSGAASRIRNRPRAARTLRLPPSMASAFNEYQEKLGFPGRAVANEALARIGG